MTKNADGQDIDTTRLLEPEDPDCAAKDSAPIRLRVFPLILVSQALLIYWIVDSEIARGVYLLCYSIMAPTVLYLLMSRVFGKWLPFNRKELLLGYIVLTASMPIIGFGGMRFLAYGMGYVSFMSQYQPYLVRYLPFLKYLPVLQDKDAIYSLYRGGSVVPWQAWIVPVAFWSIYLLLLSTIWICLAGILRRVWIHHERLTFPVALLPLQMNDRKENIFRRPLLWIGFAIPAVLQSLLVIHQWVPWLPCMQLKAFNAAPLIFTSPPWNAIPELNIGFYPMAIGLAYFIPGEVSFSCWFLSLAMRFVYVIAAAFGTDAAGTGASRFPYREEQAAGSWIGFALLLIWGARHHWATVAKSVPKSEISAVRALIVVAVACTVACAGMMMMAGIPKLAAILMILVYIAYTLSGARVRAESGGQWTFGPLHWTANRVSNSVLGTQGMGDQALLASGHFHLVHVDIRAQSLPYLMEGLSIADKSGIRWRTVLTWVAIGTLSALALGWWATISKLYECGAATAKADQYAMRKLQIGFDEVNRLAGASGLWDAPGVAAMVFAGLFTVALAWFRGIGLFGLHPMGYVLCNTLTMGAFVVPFFIAWLAKTLMLRFGGSRAYHNSVPFFIGIVLGDVMIQAGWTLVGWLLNVPIYQFLT